MRKVLILDTSVLCVWLDVPGMEGCGPDSDRWDKLRVEKKYKKKNRIELLLCSLLQALLKPEITLPSHFIVVGREELHEQS